MESQVSQNNYGKYYYTHCCGANYQRTDEWLNFFRGVATRVKATINPSTVLDAGCAKGFLVEAFRECEIEAFGVDLSEYAVSEAYSPIKPFLKVQSLTQTLGRKFDLIISIEVLEHMPQKDALIAIQNICSHTDDVVFSSSPFDYGEPTHINVHPPEYWAAEFARNGFYRDLDFDGSFLTPWTVRFRRKTPRMDELVLSYERRMWELSQAEQGARMHASQVQGQLAELQQVLDEENSNGKAIAEHIRDLRKVKQQNESLNQQVSTLLKAEDEFWNSRSGALVKIIRSLKSTLRLK